MEISSTSIKMHKLKIVTKTKDTKFLLLGQIVS
jgi:hypothetical protein